MRIQSGVLGLGSLKSAQLMIYPKDCTPKPPLYILGAGFSGLSVAYHSTMPYCIFERGDEIGGLCRSYSVNGFTFDIDGHLLHFRSPYIKNLVTSFANGELEYHKRNAWIHSHGAYTKYPFQANTYGLPKEIIDECLEGKREVAALNEDTVIAANFSEWIQNSFGSGIAKHFMKPYNQKFWKVPLEQLSTDWMGRFVPVPTLQDVDEGSKNDADKPWGYNSDFWYPRRGGIQSVAEGFSSRAGSIYTCHEITQINAAQKRLEVSVSGNRSSVPYDVIVSTLPLVALGNLIEDLPDDVLRAFKHLRHTSVLSFSLGINRPDISDKHWIYFPEDSFSFYRVGFPGNFSRSVNPKGTSSLYAEVSYLPENKPDLESVKKQIIEDLKRVDILKSTDQILAEKLFDIKYAYVIYDQNRALALNTIDNFLKKHGILCSGRYGKWAYMSMEDTLIDGINVARSAFQLYSPNIRQNGGVDVRNSSILEYNSA